MAHGFYVLFSNLLFNETHDMSNQNKFQFNRPCSNFFHISCFSNNCAILNLYIIQNTLSSCLWFFLSLVFQAVHSTVTPYGLKTSCLGAHLDTCTLPFEKHLHFIDQSNSRLVMNTAYPASFELLHHTVPHYSRNIDWGGLRLLAWVVFHF